MLTTLRYTLIRLRGQIVGWGLAIAALGLLIVPFWDLFMEQQADFMEMLENYPPEFLAFFGGDVAALMTPEGFLGMYGFALLPPILGIFAILAGSGLFARDEEGGQLDLILAHPVGRTRLFWGRLLALIAAAVAIVVLGWLGFSLLLRGSTIGISWGQMALPFLPLLAQVLVYGTLALVLSMVLPARRFAATVAGAIMVASYLLSSMARLSPDLETIARFLPYHYFQSGDALNGLNWTWFLSLMGASAALALLAWWRFQQRDIRVAGEGSWRVPSLRARLARRTTLSA
jgi:ABC-2 type transport system permease protein